MPRRPRDRRSRPEAAERSVGGSGRRGSSDVSFVEDPMGSGTAEIRKIQPYQATKTYICPGCSQEIRPGTGHIVIVPLSDPTDRRHWHLPCWEHRARRRPTGR